MRVLSVYNRYLNRGGEDQVFESELRLLGPEALFVHIRRDARASKQTGAGFGYGHPGGLGR